MLSPVTITVIPTAGLTCPLNTWHSFSLPSPVLIPIWNYINANGFITFPVDAGKRGTLNSATALLLSQHFPNTAKKKKKKKEKIKAKPTLLHSSFIADNFIRCQEKQKIQTLNNSFTVIFGSRKWKTQQAGGEESFNIGICERQQ